MHFASTLQVHKISINGKAQKAEKMNQITSNEFKRLLNQPQKIDNNKITEPLGVVGNGFVHDIIIKDCVFCKTVEISNSRFFKSLTIENCTFEKGVYLNSIEIQGEFKFNSCSFADEVIFKDLILAGFKIIKTNFKYLLFTGYLKNNAIKNEEVSFLDSYSQKVEFDDLECNKIIRLKDLQTGSLNIYRSNFHSELSFGNFENEENFYADNVYFLSSKFHERVDFYNGKIEERFDFHKVEFEEQVVITRNIEIKSINFTEIRAKLNVSIDFQDNFESLEFCDCWFNSSLTVHNFEKLTSYSKSVSINFAGVIYGNYIIEEIPTISIDISCINFGNIIFHNIDTKFIILNRFFNYNKLFFNSIRYNDKYNILVIYDSNIGNTEFENIDFRKFNEVVIVKSDVSNMLLTNSLFPKNIQIKSKAPRLGYEIPELEKINDDMYFRDSYRQLKVAMEKMGNRYYSLRYKSKEMYYQRKELKWGSDKILLYINYISNNNGISWIRGIFFTLACAFIAFLVLNSKRTNPLFYWTFSTSITQSCEAFKIGFKSYISFISSYPIFKIENINSSWAVDFIILLTRIFVSVGIYQTIVAFRKYGYK